MTRTEFLREQTVSGANKCRRTPCPSMSSANEDCSLSERKALALKLLFDTMPVYIRPRELIVGTRTYFTATPGNEDGHDIYAYSPPTRVLYINEKDIELFGCNQSYYNKTHYTPDFSIILHKGIDGIIREAMERREDTTLHSLNREFLSAIVIAYTGMKNLILRYAEEALALAGTAAGEDREELLEIARICRKISGEQPDTFHEAVQLFWFAHLCTIIESFEQINYGRVDVILGEFLKDTPREEASQLIDCLLLKMYDQVDLTTGGIGKYSAQLVATLGGVLPDGESAVNDVTMYFLDAIDRVRLPEPEFNLRLHSKNPPEFLDRAAELTVSGCNFVSYFNDDLFVESLHRAGIPAENAREYSFDLCQDINIPGKGDFYTCGNVSLSHILMNLLKNRRDFASFGEFLAEYKRIIAGTIAGCVERFSKAEAQMDLYAAGRFDEYFDGIRNHGKPVNRNGNSPMAPLPLLSALYHGSIEKALDLSFEPYPIKAKGLMFGTAAEAVNSLAAIKKTVFDKKLYTLDEIYTACENNFAGDDGAVMKNILWNCPKWGNDDDYIDSITIDILEFGLKECRNHKTYFGGQVLGGIHQPHPVPTGKGLMATPEGRYAGVPTTVTLTPETGTMKNGPTAALRSASKLDPMLIQWNLCVMVNYFASVFK
ncbi:MAG: hypothetical protein IJ334_18370 [Clostridia bacterium]|nr:hypothetical protein [Clostridia bacterium]